MPTIKDILIRTIDLVTQERFVSKNDSLVNPSLTPTSVKVANSYELFGETPQHMVQAHEKTAEDVIAWITGLKITAGSSEYIVNCVHAVHELIDNPDSKPHFGLICSLYTAYLRHLESIAGMDKVTSPNAFAADPGVKLVDYPVEVINIANRDGYRKISLVDNSGHLITFSINNETKKALTPVNVGDKILLSGMVYKNKFSTPFETTMSRPTFKLI